MKHNYFKCVVISGLAALLTACGGGNSSTNSLGDIDLIPVYMKDDNGKTLGTYLTPDGKRAFDKEFFSVDFFSDGLALVKQIVDDKYIQYSFINTKGEKVFDAPEKVTGFWNGLAWARKEDKTIVALNTKGEEVFVLDGSPRTMFNADGKALVKNKDGVCGVVDKKGAVSLLPDTLVVDTDPVIYANRLVVRNNNTGLSGVINLKGDVMVDFGVYRAIYPFDVNGCARAETDEGSVWIDKDGKKLSDVEFRLPKIGRFESHCDGDLYLFAGNGQVDYRPCELYHSWRDKNGNEVGQLADLGRVAKAATHVGAIFRGFYGNEYAYWGNFRIDRKGNVMEMPFHKALSPLIGGKVMFADLDDGKIGLFNKEGELLNDEISYIPECVGDMERKFVKAGASYINIGLLSYY